VDTIYIYDISTDTMKEVTEEVLVELQEVHRAYGRVRLLLSVYREETAGWEAEDKLVSFIAEADAIHQELKDRLERGEASEPD
jgi:hypothetical protein